MTRPLFFLGQEMSACLTSSGGSSPAAAAYSFEIEKVKSPPSRATSPSSTITESSNSPLTISTRKPRTQRKRPNQTYNEAAALLSTAYPTIFSNINTNNYMYNTHSYGFANDEVLLSFEEPEFMFIPTIQSKSEFSSDQKEVNSGVSESEVNHFEFSDEFDAESILEEEIEEGIDSIMGSIEAKSPGSNRGRRLEQIMMMKRSSRGLRSALRERNNEWRFHTVDFEQISPRIQTVDVEKTDVKKSKKKKKKVTATGTVSLTELSKEEKKEEGRSGHTMLKLDYDDVLEAWSDKTSPFWDEVVGSEANGADVDARLAQIDLFGDGGMREASVLRYKEKRRTRLFSKKIRYQVRKLNADQRPRMKGRFVSRPNASPSSGQR